MSTETVCISVWQAYRHMHTTPKTFYASIWFLCMQSCIWILKGCINVWDPLPFQHVIAWLDGLRFYALIQQLGFQNKVFQICCLFVFLCREKYKKLFWWNWRFKYFNSKNKFMITRKSNPFILFIAFFSFKCSTFHSISTPTNQTRAWN